MNILVVLENMVSATNNAISESIPTSDNPK